jgi:hypothetical protein
VVAIEGRFAGLLQTDRIRRSFKLAELTVQLREVIRQSLSLVLGGRSDTTSSLGTLQIAPEATRLDGLVFSLSQVTVPKAAREFDDAHGTDRHPAIFAE